MLVVMQQGATEEQIEHVIDRLVELGFDVHRSTGVIHTVLGGVGGKDDFDLAVFEVMEGVKEAHRIVSPYKLASRSFPAGRHGRARSAMSRSAAIAWSSWPARAAWKAATRSSSPPRWWPRPARG